MLVPPLLHRAALESIAADRAPAEFFLQTFAMDLAAVKRLEARYQQVKRPDQARALLKPRIETARREAGQSDPAQARLAWLEAANAHQQLGETAEHLECLENAVRCDASNYESRVALGTALYQARQFAEAKEHLAWCLRRKPRDEKVRSQFDKLLNEELRVADHAARTRPSAQESAKSRLDLGCPTSIDYDVSGSDSVGGIA